MASLFKTIAKAYQKSVHKSLARYGLRYEDIIISEGPDVKKALKYIPKEEVEARNRRLKRAIDLSFKQKCLPKEIQAQQEPGKFYMADTMAEVREIRRERERLLKSKYIV
eukprot:maker-scaffold_21-snap-gene-1.0-mRNA-1 protein AED:0.00 eAED:0.00 QI:138/1/1/1/1/1/2/106/109